MKIPKIATALSQIDEDLLAAANAKPQKRKHTARFWIPVAACLCLALILGALILPPPSTQTEEESRSNKTPLTPDTPVYTPPTVTVSNHYLVWPWELRTLSEQYTTLTYQNRSYGNRGRQINASLLGESLGTFEAWGFDTYEEKEYRKDFEVYSVDGISSQYLIAVKMADAYYVFDAHQAEDPRTLGELMDAYDMPHTLPLTHFTLEESTGKEQSYTLNSDAVLWEILSQCRDATPLRDAETAHISQKPGISFTVTSEALGTYKTVFLITDDGYLWTNVFDYARIYFVGRETAEQIRSYATAHATPTEPEPYEYTLAGKITEVGEGYFLLDDTLLCVDPAQGQVYRITCTDLRLIRHLVFEGLGVGDVVVVAYDGVLSEENRVEGAYRMNEGKLCGGSLLVPD